MKSISATVMCVIAGSLMSVVASAQCPVSTLAGTTWAYLATDNEDNAAVGIFSMSTGTSRSTPSSPATTVGVLTVTQTTDIDTAIINQTFPGQFSLNADCSGGNLIFDQGGNGYQFSFLLVNAGSEMLFLNQNSAGSGNLSGFGATYNGFTSGRAKKLPAAPSCPAGGPLSVLNGTTWGFQTAGAYGGYLGTFTASLGTSRTSGSVPVGTTIGVLNVTESYSGTPFSANFGNTIVREDVVPGGYTVNSDCSGGTLIFNTSGLAGMGGGMYAFVFTSPTQIYMVANSNTVPSPTTGGTPITTFDLIATSGEADVQ